MRRAFQRFHQRWRSFSQHHYLMIFRDHGDRDGRDGRCGRCDCNGCGE